MAALDERHNTGDVERYEQLRSQAIGGEASGWRLGLALLQRRGVAAWMRAWDGTAAATVPANPEITTSVGDEVVGVLATMALACLGER